MDESLKVFCVIYIANNQAAEVEQPGKEPFHFPSSDVTAQWSSVLGSHATVAFVWCNHLCSVLLQECFIKPVAVVGFVADQSYWNLRHYAFVQCFLHLFHFSRRSAFCPQGERKTMAVCNAHDLGALASLGLPNLSPPFLAGTKVPSTKHSLTSSPPASLRCSASTTSSFSITPERTQFWKRRCAVWYGPYRDGRSLQGAPVRKIHSAPLNTTRRSLQHRASGRN